MKKLLSLLLFIGFVCFAQGQTKMIISKDLNGDSVLIGINTVYVVLDIGGNSKVLNTPRFTNPIYLNKSITGILMQSPESWLKLTAVNTVKPYAAGKSFLIKRSDVISIMEQEDGNLYVKTKNPQYNVVVEPDEGLQFIVIDVVNGF